MSSVRGLSLSSSDWRELSESLAGSTWHSTWLDPRWIGSIPEMSGVYILHTFPEFLSEKYTLPPEVSGAIYVGKSQNLNRRFQQHTAPKHDNDRIIIFQEIFRQIRFSYALVPAEFDDAAKDWLANAEHALVVALDPPANRVIPAGASMMGKLNSAVPVGCIGRNA